MHDAGKATAYLEAARRADQARCRSCKRETRHAGCERVANLAGWLRSRASEVIEGLETQEKLLVHGPRIGDGHDEVLADVREALAAIHRGRA